MMLSAQNPGPGGVRRRLGGWMNKDMTRSGATNPANLKPSSQNLAPQRRRLLGELPPAAGVPAKNRSASEAVELAAAFAAQENVQQFSVDSNPISLLRHALAHSKRRCVRAVPWPGRDLSCPKSLTL